MPPQTEQQHGRDVTATHNFPPFRGCSFGNSWLDDVENVTKRAWGLRRAGGSGRTGPGLVKTGDFIVLSRSAVVLLFALPVAGCANEAPNITGFTTTSALAISAPSAAMASTGSQQGYRKTMSDRVLAAIALERVTGLKPDPARLSE